MRKKLKNNQEEQFIKKLIMIKPEKATKLKKKINFLFVKLKELTNRNLIGIRVALPKLSP